MLAKSDPDGPEHSTCREAVVRCLSNYQFSPCGQGESPSSSLSKQSDDQLVKELLGISRIASLEARYKLSVCILNFNIVHNIIVKMVIESDLDFYRIHNVTTSCIKVWVSKMKGDHERYLKQTRDKLSAQYASELEQHKGEFLHSNTKIFAQ